MSAVVPTPWWAVPAWSQIRGRSGQTLIVGERDSATSVVVDGRRWPCDPSALIDRIVPDRTDALIGLMSAFPGAIIVDESEQEGTP